MQRKETIKTISSGTSDKKHLEVPPRSSFRPDVEPKPCNPYNIKPEQGVPKYDKRRGMYYYGKSLDELYEPQRFFSSPRLKCIKLILIIAMFYYLYNKFIDKPSSDYSPHANPR